MTGHSAYLSLLLGGVRRDIVSSRNDQPLAAADQRASTYPACMTEVGLLPLRALVEAHSDEVKAIAARYGSPRIAIFGSVARGDESTDSDIDFLSDFEPGRSLFDLMRMEDDLIALLGHGVDVVEVKALKRRDDDIRADTIWL